MNQKCIVIFLAAGAGKRMNSSVAKQYMPLGGKPVVWYGLQAIQNSELVSECIFVVGKGEVLFAKEEIVKKYHFDKVKNIIEGGAMRFISVKKALENCGGDISDSIILIQDAARPFLTEQMMKEAYEAAKIYQAACVAVPVKDTIRMTDGCGNSVMTPARNRVFQVQTPQAFLAPVIMEAYDLLWKKLTACGFSKEETESITDDCMIVEEMLKKPVRIVNGSYTNIKLTTPEDFMIAEKILEGNHFVIEIV